MKSKNVPNSLKDFLKSPCPEIGKSLEKKPWGYADTKYAFDHWPDNEYSREQHALKLRKSSLNCRNGEYRKGVLTYLNEFFPLQNDCLGLSWAEIEAKQGGKLKRK